VGPTRYFLNALIRVKLIEPRNRHRPAVFLRTREGDAPDVLLCDLVSKQTILRMAQVASEIDCKQNRPTEVSLLEQISTQPGSNPEFYSLFFPDFFAAAQRFRIASAILFRAAADIPLLFFGLPAAGVGLFVLPGGRPRRLGPT
jgi:hypothetical protein